MNIQTTSSLPSTPTVAAEDRQANPLPSFSERAPSPAFSTTSTAEGGSSPLLPPLPEPTHNGRTLNLLRTPPSAPASLHSSHYYTASWGSPYQEPLSTNPRIQRESESIHSDTSEDSPVRHLEFHTPFLRPIPYSRRFNIDPEFVSHDGLISAAVLANRARRRPQGLTEDWIRQHTGGEAAERNNWLSDGPGDSGHSSLSGSISGGDNDNWLNDPKTPTIKRFLSSRPSHHTRLDSRATVTQEDFSLDIPEPARMEEPKNEEKPLPSPPKEVTWDSAALSAPVANPVPTTSPSPGPPRLKKKVPWKGKSVMVLLPWDDERGQKGKAPTPMSGKDVEAMLRDWEQLGYDTTGFNLGQSYLEDREGGEGQSRSPWPQSQDMVVERQEKAYNVSIPDKRGMF